MPQDAESAKSTRIKAIAQRLEQKKLQAETRKAAKAKRTAEAKGKGKAGPSVTQPTPIQIDEAMEMDPHVCPDRAVH